MDLLTDYYAYRHYADRTAELRREADAFRLTRVLAERHATLFPRARRFGAGLIGLAAAPAAQRRASSGRRTGTTPAAVGNRRAVSPRPCPC